MLKLTHDNHNNSHGKVDDLMALANRINKTQEEMKGNLIFKIFHHFAIIKMVPESSRN